MSIPRPPARLALVAALLLAPSVARAHIGFRGSDPATGSTLTSPPQRITLRFTERPQPGFSRIRLIGPQGEVALDSVVVDTGNTIVAAVPAALVSGGYVVRWQAASADGHVIRGEFSFTLAEHAHAPSAALRSIAEHAAPPDAHEQHTQYQSVRWIEFVALITMLGVLGFRHAVLPSLAARGIPTADAADGARRLGLWAIAFYLAAAGYRLYAESVAVHGAANALQVWSIAGMLSRTTWGLGWLAGVFGAGALLAGWLLSRHTVAVGTPLALLGGLGLVVGPALSGHATSGAPMLLSVCADALHVLAAGAWSGGLLVVVVAGVAAMKRVSGDEQAAIAALVNSFHPLALVCVTLLVLSGLTSSWLRLGSLGALWGSGYGRTLLVKVALFAAVAVMGFHNAARARRQLGSETGSSRFQRTAIAELVLVALVLAATTVLVVTPFPAEMPSP